MKNLSTDIQRAIRINATTMLASKDGLTHAHMIEDIDHRFSVSLWAQKRAKIINGVRHIVFKAIVWVKSLIRYSKKGLKLNFKPARIKFMMPAEMAI